MEHSNSEVDGPVGRSICVIGTEGTGKSELARALADALDAVLVPEAARTFVAAARRPMRPDDVATVARMHLVEFGEAMRTGRLVVLDTDLLSTVVYARHYFGSCADWIVRAERANRSDRYLLCEPDLPFVPEHFQRGSPDDRKRIHERLLSAVRRRRIEPIRVRGVGPARLLGAFDELKIRNPRPTATDP